MTPPLRGLKSKTGEKHLDSVLEMKLRDWTTAKPNSLETDVEPLFKRMHEFAREIRTGGFGSALENLSIDDSRFPESLPLTELIADKLGHGIDLSDTDIKRKSLQETLYLCTGIGPELPPPEFGQRFENFLAQNGSKGFLRVFLSVHLSNLIFTDLRDFLQASGPEELRRWTQAIERMCQKAAAAAVRPINDWPEPDCPLMATLLLDLKAEITRTFNNVVSSHRRV